MSEPISRRAWIAGAVAIGSTALAAEAKAVEQSAPASAAPFGYCLNTSTVRLPEGQWGKSRPIVELIDVAAKAGYQAIEPWISELEEYTKGGGKLADLRKRIEDAGLKVPDAIGFAEWIIEDESRRKKGLEQAKRDMDLVQQIGGVRLAAPPVGATGGASRRDDPRFSQPIVDLIAAADRYRALLELGRTMGITPIVEVWGFSKTLSRLGETLLVASECGKEGGCVLPDVYHLYKGGSEFTGLKLLGPNSIGIFHINDYPKIDRPKIVDADRVFPGDGIAPLKDVVRTLKDIGYRGFLSLELFNKEYWKQDPHQVAKTGLDKMKTVVKEALS
ncbi:sugar phosphate isomerase/epimerase family protein [Fimbriiglobus ruber]|uniref:Inosose isomerase n=1 Tax=Fimbriiglobus ruber TaxID=1908690 RepID=A0A225D381_9BACT|nr:sugar phosphate isomerase/epimerase family protein [Fimbriiglobus ruber]OWK35962.1 Inosose isomerase [Fimbriiglobus ruber]